MDDYFTLKKYGSVECNIKVIWYDYGIEPWYGEKNHGVVRHPHDISHLVVNYSYDCGLEDQIRQSASLTLKAYLDDKGDLSSQFFLVRDGNRLTARECVIQLIKTYIDHESDTYDANGNIVSDIKEWNLGFFYPISDTINYSPTTGEISLSLSGLTCLLTSEYGGSPMTMVEGRETITPYTCTEEELGNYQMKKGFRGYKKSSDGFYTVYMKELLQCAISLSVAQDTDINGELFYGLAMGSWGEKVSIMQESAIIPIDSYNYHPLDGTMAIKVPYDIDFDPSSSRMDMINQVLEISHINGHIWVDEDRVLQIKGQQQGRSEMVALWRDYGFLFISEDNSYDWNNYFNVTEVYGKDNQYYGKCDESGRDGNIVRKQTLSFDSIESNEECKTRAEWENWKARHRHRNLNVTIADNYIKEFKNPSNIVGQTIEYTTTNGETDTYLITKISTSGTTISLSLELFTTLYATRYDGKPYDKQLKTPWIYKYEIIYDEDKNRHFIRLYVTGEDISNAVAVKLYGRFASADDAYFSGESANETSDGNKYIDFDIDQSGKYIFYVTLYHPCRTESNIGGAVGEEGLGNPYIVTVNKEDIAVKFPPVDNYPYPHRNIYEDIDPETHYQYLMTENGFILSTENNENITL